MNRTYASETSKLVGKEVTVKGWVNSVRSHGKIVFFDLRDRSGLLQVVMEKARVKPEDIIAVTGTVVKRPANLVNPKIVSGSVELQGSTIEILSPSRELPFPLDGDGLDIDEDLRLKYRYLDLRRPRLANNLTLRSKYVQSLREYLFECDFTEIETPLLTKSSPEGSRDFVVPSRHYPGQFYALPQSPQQYKQLLMTAGFEKYFQTAKCLRDEDPRADRAYEHTQLDLEMSFVTKEDVMSVVEGMITHALGKVGFGDKIISSPFPVITYESALAKYGADKFDLRTPEEKQAGKLAFAWVVDFPFFEKTEDGGFTFTHNPFSAPSPEHEQWLLTKQNVEKIVTQQYDLVCNGREVGGGSIRANSSAVLRSTFEIMGYKDEEINEQFGHMLSAFDFGTPPHGGCAHGFERLLMILQNEEYIREVQAFPMSGKGHTSVMFAPSALDHEQLSELKLEIVSAKKFSGGQEVFAAIVKLLEDKKITGVKVTEHAPVLTSEEAAKVRGTNIDQGAKALVLYGDKKPLMVVVPGSVKVDMKAIKKLANIKDLRMASPDEVTSLTSLPIGAIPPFGSLFGIETYCDIGLSKNERIVFNAGLHDHSIEMSYKDWARLENPLVSAFAQM